MKHYCRRLEFPPKGGFKEDVSFCGQISQVGSMAHTNSPFRKIWDPFQSCPENPANTVHTIAKALA